MNVTRRRQSTSPAALAVILCAAVSTGAAAPDGGGRQVFQSHCAVCHGSGATGDGPAARGLDPKPANLRSPQTQQKTPAQLRAIVQNGIEATAMTAWKGVLSEEQIGAVVEYIKSLSQEPRVRAGTCTSSWCAT